jgi:hypothetical protein
MGRTMRSSAAAAVLVAGVLAGCGDAGTTAVAPAEEPAPPRCDGSLDGYRVKGRALRGDVDADGRRDRVTVRVDRKRPKACRHVVVAELGGRAVVAPVKPLPWFGTDPRLLLLAEIDGRPGVEAVVSMSPAAVYRPGKMFTIRDGEFARMRLAGTDLFPLEDEFPAGSDCAGAPGRIVVTTGDVGDPDSHYDVERSVYEARGTRFERLSTERFEVAVGTEERGAPFRTCRLKFPPGAAEHRE